MQETESDDGTSGLGAANSRGGLFSFRAATSNAGNPQNNHMMILNDHQSNHSGSVDQTSSNGGAVSRLQHGASQGNNNQTFNFNGCERSQQSSSSLILFGENSLRARIPMLAGQAQQTGNPRANT